jgi:hypothetical protein
MAYRLHKQCVVSRLGISSFYFSLTLPPAYERLMALATWRRTLGCVAKIMLPLDMLWLASSRACLAFTSWRCCHATRSSLVVAPPFALGAAPRCLDPRIIPKRTTRRYLLWMPGKNRTEHSGLYLLFHIASITLETERSNKALALVQELFFISHANMAGLHIVAELRHPTLKTSVKMGKSKDIYAFNIAYEA